ncbi:pterocarpan synthase 1-like [Primulina eburnea]|uniref:pterocarpan synthase 1-like n=1 Tax=Primulina eburnea TaxID=1245227 RepID=UPI003C6BE564
MEKIKSILLTLVSLATIVGIAYVGIRTSPDSLEKWLTTHYSGKEKLTKLNFYVRDIFTSPTPTIVVVASANTTFTSPTLFGLVSVFDDPVTVGPEPGSKIIGQAGGIYALASLEETSIHMTFTIVFTDGEYNGSTLSFSGHNAYLTPLRHISIVGGTGFFAFARGVTSVSTVWRSNTSGDAVFQYDSIVLHH